jgi:predicted metal-dependent hydrolase
MASIDIKYVHIKYMMRSSGDKQMIKSFRFKVETIYSKRRTIEISIQGPDIVLLRVPLRTSAKKINRVIEQKHDWITKHLDSYNQKIVDIPKLLTDQHSEWLFMDKVYYLDIIEDALYKRPIVEFTDQSIVVWTNSKDRPKLKHILIDKYKKELRRYIEGRILYYASSIKKHPKAIRIKSQRTLWGSCSSKMNLNFNCVVSFAPKKVIDYLVVHEMAHLTHMNHSKHFWRLVAINMPDYKEQQRWLKEHNYLLKIN